MFKSLSYRRYALVAIIGLWLVFGGETQAASIGPSDFHGNQFVEQFDELGIIGGQYGPLSVNGATYRTTFDDLGLVHPVSYLINDFGSQNTFGMAFGTIGNDLQYIDVIFANPVARAGAWVGMSNASVQFFDQSGTSLGTVTATRSGAPKFAGWDAGSNVLARMRFTDIEVNGTIILIDNVTSEMVPEPSTLVLLGIGTVGLLGYAWRRRQLAK
jgi:hypothetical protein